MHNDSTNTYVAEGHRAPNLEPATTRSLQPISSVESALDPKLDPNPKTGYLAKNHKPANLQAFRIGETGFEPATARPPAGCATRLRHSPRLARFYGTRPYAQPPGHHTNTRSHKPRSPRAT